MNTYHATVDWQNNGEDFTDQKYSRRHRWRFSNGVVINASASPQIVPEPYSDTSAVDPEEAFVASLASCHMLWFLSLVADNGHVVQRYRDEAEGFMDKNPEGKLAIIKVILRPVVQFADNHAPSRQQYDVLHQKAHQRCFIANSVKTDIHIDAQLGQ